MAPEPSVFDNRLMNEITEEERTTAFALLRLGHEYLMAAQCVEASHRAGLLKLPYGLSVDYLTGHAFELLLKAHMRLRGATLRDLIDLGHNLMDLWIAAVREELDTPASADELHNLENLNHIHGKAPYETRYVRTGVQPEVNLDLLWPLAERLVAALETPCRQALLETYGKGKQG